MTITLNGSANGAAHDVDVPPRPKDVGILAMEMYFPRRVRGLHVLALSLQALTFMTVHLRGGVGGVRWRVEGQVHHRSWPEVHGVL